MVNGQRSGVSTCRPCDKCEHCTYYHGYRCTYSKCDVCAKGALSVDGKAKCQARCGIAKKPDGPCARHLAQSGPPSIGQPRAQCDAAGNYEARATTRAAPCRVERGAVGTPVVAQKGKKKVSKTLKIDRGGASVSIKCEDGQWLDTFECKADKPCPASDVSGVVAGVSGLSGAGCGFNTPHLTTCTVATCDASNYRSCG